MEGSQSREFLIDVSRLVWRGWRGRLSTGIDRVAQAYVEYFGPRSQAVVQRRGSYFVFSPSDSDRLFEVFLERRVSRRRLISIFARGVMRTLGTKPRRGQFYLNAGHTGLNEPSLPGWIRRNQLRAIYLIHDLIPLTHPEYCRAGEGEKHRRRMGNVLDSAAGLIGNSQVTLDGLARFAEETGRSMPVSVAAWISGGQFPLKVRPVSMSKPYFVVVGTIEGRKNHQLLLDVWRNLVLGQGSDAPILLIVGQRGWQADRVFDQLDDLGELQDHVREFGACDDEEVAAWTAGARALLMPSFAEGFGLPVFEALQLGTPVIAADLPVYREIAGDIPTYLAPDDKDAWQRTIGEFSSGGRERDRQVAAMSGFRSPSWEDHFRTVENWLAKL